MSLDDYYSGPVKTLIGKSVVNVYMNEDYLRFETDQGDVCFTVEGDCCSRSYFHDFIGADKLRQNGPVISAKYIEVDPGKQPEDEWDEIKAYGYEMVTEHPEFGEMTSVFSFRNRSNGYYGGSLESATSVPDDVPLITGDCVLGDD